MLPADRVTVLDAHRVSDCVETTIVEAILALLTNLFDEVEFLTRIKDDHFFPLLMALTELAVFIPNITRFLHDADATFRIRGCSRVLVQLI